MINFCNILANLYLFVFNTCINTERKGEEMRLEKVFYAFGNKFKTYGACSGARKMPKQSETTIYNIVRDNGNVIGDYTVIHNHKKGGSGKNNPVQNIAETIRKGSKYKNIFSFDDGTMTQVLYTPKAYRVRKFADGQWKLVRYEAGDLRYSSGDTYKLVNSVDPAVQRNEKYLTYNNLKEIEDAKLLTKREKAQLLKAANGPADDVFKLG